MNSHSDTRLAVIGLGYVGLPLAVAFAGRFDTVGFDINTSRIDELKEGADQTGEISESELADASHLRLTADEKALADRNIYVVTVPTPIDRHNQPDLQALKSASSLVARHLKKGNLVIYESTVYPGATEEICVPILEAGSGLTLNDDFHVGYSPERINPGDKTHRLAKILKVTSGSNPQAAKMVD
ncbi:MAG: nucleotide sugar dehydrogenase, partial [Desulfobulbaceae bacterium]